MTFDDIVKSVLGSAGLERPTQIQERVWPAINRGRHVICQSPTGSGKTLGFLLPAVSHILTRKPRAVLSGGNLVEVLVLCPTRELAKQIKGVAKSFRKLFGIRSCCIYGGSSESKQLHVLRKQDTALLLGTPGRLSDLASRKEINLSAVSMVIFDEADRLCTENFRLQINVVLSNINSPHQSVFMSATVSHEISEKLKQWCHGSKECAYVLTDDFRKDKETAVAGQQSCAGPNAELSNTPLQRIVQTVQLCAEHKKPRKLMKILKKIMSTKSRKRETVLIFCNKIKTALFVKDFVCKSYPHCGALHGQMQQGKREMMLASFRAGKTHILVATDVAARGLDIKGLDCVVNWDCPPNIDQYVHRIGRVGRQGGSGQAFTFFTRRFRPLAHAFLDLLRANGQSIDPHLQKLEEDIDDLDNLDHKDGGLEDLDNVVDIPTHFGAYENLAINHVSVQNTSSDEEDAEEYEGNVCRGESNTDIIGQQVSTENHSLTALGGKGSYRELAKKDFKHAAWLAGKRGGTSQQPKSPTNVTSKGKNKKRRWTKRGKRGGKKKRRAGRK